MGLLDYDLELAKAKARQIYDTLKANTPLPGMADAMSQYQSPMAAIYSNADRLKRRVVDTLSNPMAQAQRTIGQIADNPQEFSNQLANNFAPAAMTVWHGSPHLIKPKHGGKFPEFDSTKIGTGEGAQVYGHGHYLAEAKDVAKEYTRTTRDPGFSYDGVKIDRGKNTIQHEAARLIYESGGDKAAAKKAAESYAYDNLLIPEIEKLDPRLVSIGNLYKVDIPDEAVARFLDWDKPLSQQAPEVQSAMRNMHSSEELKFPALNMDSMTGREIYDSLMNNNFSGKGKIKTPSATDASFYLGEYGIPGIRYLDGGSRGQQAGTSNFVLFDDQIPRILEINGTPTGNKPWSPGEWRGLLGE